MERNRRIAKAYARKHSLVVNGSEDEYLDGTTLGLNSFENPDRDSKTEQIKKYIGQGLKIKITQSGDIVVKRLSKANIFVRQFDSLDVPNSSSSDPYAMNSDAGDLYGIVGPVRGLIAPTDGAPSIGSSENVARQRGSSISVIPSKDKRAQELKKAGRQIAPFHSDTLNLTLSGAVSYKTRANGFAKSAATMSDTLERSSSMALDYNRSVKIFDMDNFKAMLERESRRPFPNRRLLQSHCMSVISFVADDQKMLNLSSWIMVINIVAIDLLKTELGLVDMHDLPAPSKSTVGPLTSRLLRSEASLSSTYSSSSAAQNTGPSQDRYNDRHQLAASKLAFANAAAQGAYNGDHCHAGPQKTYNSMAMSRGCAIDLDKASGGASDGELDLRRAQMVSDTQSKQIGHSQVQQSSVSSGFNSHCSSQNDSSATSSSSNIALGGAVCDEPSSDQRAGSTNYRTKSHAAKTMIHKHQAKFRNGSEKQAKSCSDLIAAASPRGDRPPKLPHRLATASEIGKQSARVSSPLVGSSDCLNGRANLILVAPTGLSPPLPKRKGVPSLEPAVRGVGGSNQLGLINEDSAQLPEFSTIKHIDENGKCRVLLDGDKRPAPASSGLKLPVGIPAHAQLAPPATQRHILRYLMSATRTRMAELGNRKQVESLVPPRYYQRPLPILPDKRRALYPRDSYDESLYYYGLQARVPSRRPVPPVQLPGSKVTRTNDMLAELRRNCQQQSNSNHNLRNQFSLTNLNDNRLFKSYQKQCGSFCNLYPRQNEQSVARKPLLSLFRASNTATTQRTSINIARTGKLDESIFSSLDNLHQTSQKSSSLLSQVLAKGGLPLRLRKTKTSKLLTHT